jgi:hypothetical protein
MEGRTYVILVIVSCLLGYLVLGDLISRWNGVYPKVQCVVMKGNEK